MRPRSVFVCLLALVACVGASRSDTRVFPLVAGTEPRAEIRRADIDDHKRAPPPVSFEVDCRALPYAKGEERDFCYQWGSWAVLSHDRGLLVACACGEFGGFVLWYAPGGELLQTLIAGDVPQTLMTDGDALICVTGISHLSISKGAIHAFRMVDDRWQSVASTPLAKEADRTDIEPDGSLLLKLMWDAGTFRYRAGSLEQLPSPSPPNSAQQPTSAPSGARG